MSKIHILYKKDCKMFGYPTIYLDQKQISRIEPGQIKVIEAENGSHTLIFSITNLNDINLKNISDGVELNTTENKAIIKTINVNNEDLYYIYHSPLILSHKGSLEKVSKYSFSKKEKKANFWSSKTGVIISIICAILLYLLFEFL